jgi:MoaA/NifB/PqqE/SkfB family radical SAM enzyme
MRQKKVCLFYDSRKVFQPLLADCRQRFGCTLVPIQDIAALPSAWNRFAAPSRTSIWIDYPVQDLMDARTVRSFVEHVIEHAGHWYYAPRPNEHLDVERAALVGMNGVTAMSGGQQGLPGRLLRRLRRLWRRGGTAPVAAVLRTSRQRLPRNLAAWSGQWQSWVPDSDALSRDLLERTDQFFPHPQSIHVVLLNKCNLACVMCPYHSPHYTSHHTSGYFEELKIMTPETFDRIVGYAGRHGISLQFGQIEEPLMHKNLFTFFRRAKDGGVPAIHVTTNGTLLDREKAEQLSLSGVDSVMFSIDAAAPDTYKAIRGGDLESLERSIQFFLGLAKPRKINTTVSFVLQPQARSEREQFLEKWRAMGADRVTFYVLTRHEPQTGRIIREEDLYANGERYPCASPWVQSVVFPDGEVSLCCKTMLEVGWRGVVTVGNLQEQTFEQIWSGPLYTRVREELLRNAFKQFSVCQDCTIWSASHYLTERRDGYTRVFNETMETFTFS